MQTNTAPAEPVVIKKYANRRLYDTGTSAYITLEDLCAYVKAGKDFTVVDAKTAQDLTRQVLTQIIFEQETKGVHILPTNFLRSVIGTYDDKMQNVLQQYLDGTMKAFISNQEKLQGMFGKAVDKAMDGLTPFNGQLQSLEEITRQNMAMFEKAVQMMNPFAAMFGAKEEDKSEDKTRVKR